MKGRAWGLPSDPPWVAPSRPVTRPMRVALAGFPSPRPDFWGGNPSVCVPAAARASSLRVRGGTTRGKRERAVTPACRAGAWDVVTRGRGTKGPASCARPSAAGPPPVTPLPRGGWCARLGARSRAGRAGLGGGGLPGPTRPHRPCPPRAVPPALPRLCRSRVRGLAVRVACVCVARCGVPCGVASLPLSPAAFPRSGSSGDPSLLGAGDPVLASRARDLSLGRGLWRNGGRSSPARRRTRRGPSPPEVLRRRRARLSRRWGLCEWGKKRRPPRVSGNLARERGLAGVVRGLRLLTVGPSAEVRLGTLPAPSSVLREGRSRRTCGEPPSAPGWAPGGEIPQRVACPLSSGCRRRGLRSMTLPVPEVRPSRASWVRGAPPPLTSLEGEDRPRGRRLSFPSASPRRVSEHARGPAFFHGVPVPSASASRPGAAAVRFSRRARWRGRRRPPRRFPVSPDPARRVRDHPVLPGVAPRCRACVGGARRGPTPAPRAPARGRRPGTSAWSVGAVCRAGARAVWRRLGGSRRVASPGSVHPPPSSRRVPLVRPRPVVVRALSPSGGVSGSLGDSRRFPRVTAIPAGGSRLFFRPGVRRHHHPRAPLARSLAGFCRLRSTAGHPSARRSPASSRSYLVDPASSICVSQRLSHACLSTHGRYSETANGSLNQLWFLWSLAPLLLG